jgi:signal peptidase II
MHESIPLIGKELLRLTYVQNPGIAFGVQILGRTPLLIFGWIAAIILSVYLFQLARRRDPLRWPVMLFLAGALGNSIDRLLFAGRVTDFVDMDFPDFIMERFAVFNVADSCVTVGIAILILLVLLGRERKSQVQPAHIDDHPFPDPNARFSSPPNSISSDPGSGPATPAD